MKIYLVRHGETDWNTRGHIQGRNDTQLNQTGRHQAEDLGESLLAQDLRAAAVYTSSQRRAAETAEIISKKLGLTCHVFPGLQEVNFGKWEGHTWGEVKEQYPDYYRQWYANRRYMKTPDGESYQDMLARAAGSLRAIAEQEQDNIIVVTHSAVIMALRCWINNDSFSDMVKKYKVGNAGIVEFDAQDIMEKEI